MKDTKDSLLTTFETWMYPLLARVGDFKRQTTFPDILVSTLNRGQRERSPPLTKIMLPSFPRLGKLQESTVPQCNGTASSQGNCLLDHSQPLSQVSMPALRMLLRALLVFQCASLQVCHLCSICYVLLFYSQTCHVFIEFCTTKETLHQDKNYPQGTAPRRQDSFTVQAQITIPKLNSICKEQNFCLLVSFAQWRYSNQ